jgi:hypothetical protein
MNDKKRILRKNKALAGSMMVVAAVLFVIARGIWGHLGTPFRYLYLHR